MNLEKLREMMEDDELWIHDAVGGEEDTIGLTVDLSELLKYFNISKKLLIRFEAFLETVVEDNFCPPITCRKRECSNNDDERECWLEYITKRVSKKETEDE